MSPTVSHLGHLVPSWLYCLGGCETCRWGSPAGWSRSLGKTFEDYICPCFWLCSPFLVHHGVHSCCDPLSHAFKLFWKSEPRLAFPLRRGLSGIFVTTVEKVAHWGVSNRRTCLSLWGLSFWSLMKERSGEVDAPLKPQIPSRPYVKWGEDSFGSFTTEPSC